MASRTIADKAAALDTLSQFFGLTRGVKVSRTAIEGLASRWAKANGSKTDRAKLARETEVLVDYLKADGADMEKPMRWPKRWREKFWTGQFTATVSCGTNTRNCTSWNIP